MKKLILPILLIIGLYLALCNACSSQPRSSTRKKAKPAPQFGDEVLLSPAILTKTGSTAVSFYRCVNATSPKVICRTTNCIAGETQNPSTNFATLTDCSIYKRYVICDKGGDVFQCVVELQGCASISAALATTTFTNLFETQAECDLARRPLVQSPKRCLSSTRGAECLQSCSLSQMTQPPTDNPPTPSWTYQGCIDAEYEVRCYNKATGEYHCVTDDGPFPRCATIASTAFQVSNSLSAEECAVFENSQHVRCVTPTAPFCRPSQRISWANNNLTTTVTLTQFPSLTLACNAGEKVFPAGHVFSTKQECLDYPASVYCYNIATSTVECSQDYECTNLTLKTFPAIDDEAEDCGGNYTRPWIRCMLGLYIKRCRPQEYGCRTGTTASTTETQMPADLTFDSKEDCMDWASQYVRCVPVEGTLTPACYPENCVAGSRFLVGDGETFIEETDCIDELYTGKICYTPTVGSYEISVAFDSDTIQIACPSGSRLIDVWVSGETREAALEAAIEWYNNSTQELQHHRCETSGGEPICRPDINLSLSGLQCGPGEVSLANSSRPFWDSLGECEAEKYWAKPCYHATQTEPFFQLQATFDTEPGCQAGDVDLGESFVGGASDNITYTEDEINTFYTSKVTLTHIRCKVTLADTSLVPVCRPVSSAASLLCDDLDEGGPEGAKLSDETHQNKTECDSKRYRYQICYRPTTTPSDYFTIEPIHDTEDGCATTDLVLADYASLPAPRTPLTPDEINDVYAEAAIPHRRCKLGTVPVCRPDMSATLNEWQCASIDNATVLQPTIPYSNLTACNEELYWGRSCYTPASSDPFYTVGSSFDTDDDDCPSPGYFITDWIAGSFQIVTDETDLEWYDSIPELTHVRCKLPDSSPYCRPSLDLTCPGTEAKLTSAPGNWSNQQDCNDNLYLAKPCYSPLQTGPDYYEVIAVYDTASSTCAEGDFELDSVHDSSPLPDITFDQTEIQNLYKNRDDLPHFRCRVENVPVCRPLVTCDSFGTEQDNGTLQNSDPAGYNGLAACEEELYWAKACYRATTNGTFHEFVAYGDTEAQNDCNTDGSEVSAGDQYSKASKTEGLTIAESEALTAANDWYSAGQFASLRCKMLADGETVPQPVCRPLMLTDTNCATNIDEGALPSSTFDDLQSCFNVLYQFHACYHPKETDQGSSQFYTLVPGYDTSQSGSNWCADGELKIGTEVLTDEDVVDHDFTAIETLLTTATVHRRCKLSATEAICRPSISGGNTRNNTNRCAQNLLGETPLTTSVEGKTSWPNLADCNAVRFAGQPCYHPEEDDRGSSGDQYYRIVAGLDSALSGGSTCATGEWRISTTYTGSDSLANLEMELQAFNTTVRAARHYRCLTPDNDVICRPSLATAKGQTSTQICSVVTGLNETQLETSYNRANYWTGIDACLAVRYIARACYTPTDTEDFETGGFFTLSAVHDSDEEDECQGNGVLDVNGFILAGPTYPIDDFDDALTYLQQTAVHRRCRTQDFSTVICRPSLEDTVGQNPGNYCSVALGEMPLTTRVGNVGPTWVGSTNCEMYRYRARACYVPSSAPDAGNYYTLVAVYDSDANTTCLPTDGVDVNGFLLYGSDKPLDDFSSAETFLNNSKTHYRCKTSSFDVICRPSLQTVEGQTNGQHCSIELGETYLQTRVDSVRSWPNFQACSSVRYVARACYEASDAIESQTGGYFTLTAVYDSDETPTCGNRTVDVNGFIMSGPEKNLANFATALNHLETTTIHYRCKNEDIDEAICRPSLSTAVGAPSPANRCGWNLDPDEVQLAVGYSIAGSSNCLTASNTITAFFAACYKKSYQTNYVTLTSFRDSKGVETSDADFIRPSDTFQCVPDAEPGCDEASLGYPYYPTMENCTAVTSILSFNTGTTRPWGRCHKGSDENVRTIICRPTSYNSGRCDTDNGEYRVGTSSTYANVDSCIMAGGDRVNSISGVTKCCCQSDLTTTNKTCGIPKFEFGAVSGCLCEECTPSTGTETWSPVRNGQFFVVYASTIALRREQTC